MRFLIVDDHVLIRDALHGVLTELRPGCEVLTASNAGEAVQFLDDGNVVDLLLLDLNLPDRDGIATLTEIRRRYPTCPVVILSAHQEREVILQAMSLGALGYIPKSATRGVMLGALQLIFAGGIYLPPEALEGRAATPPPPPDLKLTDRQMDVLDLMMKGKSNKAICQSLNLAENTVKNHVTAVLKALNASNRTEAVVAATNIGWQLDRPKG